MTFVLGREYPRPTLLEFVGSRQAQSGIIWGPRQPGAVVITSGGKHGRHAGYQDAPEVDGGWTYYGQGSAGDQDADSFANRLLKSGRRSVLLFSTREPKAAEIRATGSRAKLYRFEGTFVVASWNLYQEQSGPRRGHRVIRFDLKPAQPLLPDTLGASELKLLAGASLTEIRSKLLAIGGTPSTRTLSTAEYIARSELVRRYAHLRSNGACELCDAPAPFVCDSGLPFLEVHHLFRLADGGPDEPSNVAAICPNCHRAVHLACDGAARNALLSARVTAKEAALGHR